jgi:hypothetical protein
MGEVTVPMSKLQMYTKTESENLNGRELFGLLDMDRRIILQVILKEQGID